MKEELNITLFDPTQGRVYQGQEVEVHTQILATEEGKPSRTLSNEEMSKYTFQWSALSGRYSAPMVLRRSRPTASSSRLTR